MEQNPDSSPNHDFTAAPMWLSVFSFSEVSSSKANPHYNE